MAVNDIYRCEVYQNVGSELTMNVFHMRESVSEPDAELATVSIQSLINDLYQLWAEWMGEDYKVTTVKVRRVSPAGGIPDTIVYGGAEAVVGQLESDIVPSQAAILLSLYAETNDRTGRGRQYLPGCAESIQKEGQLEEAHYVANSAALHTFYQTEHGPVGGGTGKYRFNIWQPPAAGAGDHDVVRAYVHPNLATQRRRRHFPGFS